MFCRMMCGGRRSCGDGARMACSGVAIFLLCFEIHAAGPTGAPSSASAIDAMSAEEADVYWFVRDAILEQMRAIRQGVCRIGMTISEVNGDEVQSQNTAVFYAFDDPAELFRFDRNPDTQVKADGSIEPLSDEKVLRFVSTPDGRISWSAAAGVLSVCGPDHEPESYDGVLNPFDIRAVGLLIPRDYAVASHHLDAALELFWTKVGGFDEITVTESKDEVLITWENEASTRTVHVNKTNGYHVTRMVFVQHLPEEFGGDTPVYETDVEWENHGDAWVPSAVSANSGGGTITQGNRTTVEVQFSWESVNESVSTSLFTEADLRIPDLTLVVDISTPNPVVIRRIGEEEMIAKAKSLVSSAPRPRQSRNVIGLVAANVVLFLALTGVFLYRRLKSKG